ncbi:hypothetical protein [Emticicia oligotrophica]|uniref:hypothetical protein n=1 Tax=Emticicia oligotrophica TaxID=312279 RepID=UPI00273C3A7A|nr:hypothetical protein [Emticicia oligotrophica]
MNFQRFFKRQVLLFSLTLLSNTLLAQNTDFRYSTPKQTNLDFVLATGKGGSLGLSYTKLFAKTKNNHFKTGYGLRLTSFFSGRKNYITAPAKLTTGKNSPFTMFQPIVETNLDTISINKSAVIYLNAKVAFQYSIRRIDVGFDIDVMGLSLGNTQISQFRSQTINARPRLTNFLLMGDNDRGSINSEFYMRYWLNLRTAIRAGISYQFIEYNTDKPLDNNNDRFRAKIMMPFIAFTFSPYKWAWKDFSSKKYNR